MAEIKGALLQWADTPEGSYGEGVSRPKSGSRTKEFRLIVYPKGAKPLTWITRAENKAAAIKYAQNRWPSCQVELA